MKEVYTWGSNDGGMLGCGECGENRGTPALVLPLRGLPLKQVCCGGLHTVVLTEQGKVYSFGKGEGGQLGHPQSVLQHDKERNSYYLEVPTRVRGAIDNLQVTQVACGESHTLVLTSKQEVFSWGYTINGQLGIGVDERNISQSKYPSLAIYEPVRVEALQGHRIL